MKTIILFLVISITFSQVEISGTLSGTLYQADSPYLVTDDLEVPVYNSLTIEPGVEVIFMGSYHFLVSGQLLAEGTEADSIRFRSSESDITWQGFDFHYNTGASILSYCDVSATNGTFNLNYSQDLTISDSYVHDFTGNALNSDDMFGTLAIDNSIIEDGSSQSLIDVSDTMLALENVQLHGSDVTINGIQFSGSGQLTLYNSILSGFTNYGATVSGNNFIHSVINCNFLDSQKGMYINNGSDVDFTGCNFLNNLDEGILLSGNNESNISGCLFEENQNGVYVNNSSSYVINDCIFESNGYGFRQNGGNGSNTRTIQNSTFEGNTSYAIRGDSSGRPNIFNCLVSDNERGVHYPGTIINSVVTNTQLDYAIINAGNVINCTVSNNQSGVTADHVRNSIVYFNYSNQVSSNDVTYSCIQGGSAGIGNISENPAFLDYTDYMLHETSPCIDAGNPETTYYDLCFPPSNGTALNDMGAYGGPEACEWMMNDAGGISVSPTILHFGTNIIYHSYEEVLNIQSGITTSKTYTVYFSDSGNTSEGDFSISSSELIIDPEVNQQLPISFNPTSEGVHNAIIVIEENTQTTGQTFQIQLVGFAINGSEISGTLSGTLYQADSPYLVTDDLEVPVYNSLTIEPGVEVIFMGSYHFLVSGQLLAEGTEADSIRFRSSESDITWQGFDFHYNTGASILSYCDVSATNGTFNLNYSQDLTISDSYVHDFTGNALNSDDMFGTLAIDNSIIEDGSSQSLIDVSDTMLALENVQLHGSDVTINGIQFSGSGQLTLYNSILSGFTNYGATVSGNNFIHSVINCNFLDSQKGMYINNGSDVDFTGCNFLNNLDEGILLSGNNESNISGCLFEENQNGVYVNNSSSYVINDCIFESNGYGFRQNGGNGSNTRTIQNSTFEGNTSYAIRGDSSGRPNIFNCLVSDNERGVHYPGTIINSVVTNTQLDYAIINAGNVINCTVSNNQSGVTADHVRNSIVYFNYSNQVSSNDVTYSCIQGGSAGIGNISENPAFLDYTDYMLHETSPCIDAGNPETTYYDLCFPPSNGTALNDMGAYGGPEACEWVENEPPTEENIIVEIPELTAEPGDTVLIPILITMPDTVQIDSYELVLSFQGEGISVLSINHGNYPEFNQWLLEYNLDSNPITIWSAGFEPISGSGEVLHIEIAISADADSEFVPITIESVTFDEIDYNVVATNGGINIVPPYEPPPLIPNYGDVSLNGEITALDASMILYYVVQSDSLSDQQLLNSNVSGDSTVSAFDASLILQYGVGLIDVFPADTGSFYIAASGAFSLEDQQVSPLTAIEVPLYLEGGENIYSFEFLFEYDADIMQLTDVIGGEHTSEFIILFHDENGDVRISGANAFPDGLGGTFITMLFNTDEFNAFQTEISLISSRINENPLSPSTASSILNNSNYQLGDVDDNGSLNVVDVVFIVGIIFGDVYPNEYQFWSADINNDGLINVVDVVELVGMILGSNLSRYHPVNTAKISQYPSTIEVATDGSIGGVQMSVSGNYDIFDLHDPWTYRKDSSTLLIYSLAEIDESSITFGYNGELIIEDVLIADIAGNYVEGEIKLLPAAVFLEQIYPNPFNPLANINFTIPTESNVKVDIFDIQGRLVTRLIHSELGAGRHSLVWNAIEHPSGSYIVKIDVDGTVQTQKMILLK